MIGKYKYKYDTGHRTDTLDSLTPWWQRRSRHLLLLLLLLLEKLLLYQLQLLLN
jgi:hypothetical protein